MQVPLEITFRSIDPSLSVEAAIRERVAKLQKFNPTMISCRVVVESPHRHHHQGNLYGVKIEVEVPGKKLAFTREPDQARQHEDLYVALRDAFEGIKRQLKEDRRLRRAELKLRHMRGPESGRLRRSIAQL